MKNRIGITLIFILFFTGNLLSKQYKGAEYRTKATYTYGRFEVRMKPAHRSGVVSSFFTYHEIQDISEWNEIDIENIGRYDDQIQFNVISPNQTNHVRNQVTGFNPYADFHEYAFEWTPFYIAWFIDGNEVYRQTSSHVGTINKDQKVMMNLWPADAPNWVGTFDGSTLPAFAFYDWVKYYEYTPGSGNYGTDNNFTLNWTDDFEFFDTSRWQKATHTFNNNLCDFTPENAVFNDGKLILCLTDENHLGYQDHSAPKVSGASAFSNGKIKIKFSEELETSSAENASNYFITTGSVTSAQLSDDKTAVILSTENYNPEAAANIIVQNVKDLAGNPISPAATSVLPLNFLTLPAKINVGGDAVLGFLGDLDWDVTGQYGHISGYDKIWNGINIGGTNEDLIYLRDREGLTKYLVRVPNGNYKVTFMFAEKFWNNSGKRVVDVYLENQLKIDNLDIYNSAGINTALDLSVTANVTDEILDIIFSPETDISTLSGIKIERMPDYVAPSGKSESFNLYQNYPNPFNPTTKINFGIETSGNYKLNVYNLTGEKVSTIVNQYFTKGKYSVVFDGKGLSSGVYLYELENNGKKLVNKMVLLK